MIFGKHINKYYLIYAPMLLLGLAALILVDYMQLFIPGLYELIVNGMKDGSVMVDGVLREFNLDFLIHEICMPMVGVILCMILGRFLWRICFLGSAIKVDARLRNKMFDHAKDLSREYYQVNKVGSLMSLFTNDLDSVQESFGWGIMMFCDAVFLGVLATVKMFQMDWVLTVLSLIPMALLLASSIIVGERLSKNGMPGRRRFPSCRTSPRKASPALRW